MVMRENVKGDRRMNKTLMGFVIVAAVVVVVLGTGSDALAQAETKKEVKEIMVTVKPGIIVLPGKTVSSVPLSAVRIRSTKLRDLNKECGAVSIEAVCKLVEKKAEDTGGVLASESKGKVKVDRAKKIRKLLTEEKNKDKEMVPVRDAYVIQFADYRDEEDNLRTVNLDEAIVAYEALSVVISAGKVSAVGFEVVRDRDDAAELEEKKTSEKKGEKERGGREKKKGR
jgi:hypothetical protein